MTNSLEHWLNRSWLARYAVIVIALVAGGIVAVTVFPAHQRSSQVTLSMRPVPPPTAAACRAQARHYGYSVGAAGQVCQAGPGHSWYHAKLTNRGPYDFMSCRAVAVSASGKTVFKGPLPFEFAGPRGLFAPGHRSIAFSWYLPRKTARAVARYTATCQARSYPWT